MERKNAVIVAYGRSGIAKAIKGSLRYTGCVDFGSQVLRGILAKNPGFDPALAEDLICGCAIPEAEQGLNIGRLLADSSGFPLSTAASGVAPAGSTTCLQRSISSRIALAISLSETVTTPSA